jgi:hypothetical protein
VRGRQRKKVHLFEAKASRPTSGLEFVAGFFFGFLPKAERLSFIRPPLTAG